MAPTHSYLVCATQRSGSTLLCELLKDTGVAGSPEEYFEAKAETGLPPHPGDYLDDLPPTGVGIRQDVRPPPAPEHSALHEVVDYRTHLERSFRLGTSQNGVFGAKLMWRQLPELEALAGELPEYRGLRGAGLLDVLFDQPRYVWVSRRDKVRQAISLWRALQTRTWRAGHPGQDDADAELHYSFQGIDHLVRSLSENDVGWEGLFREHQIPVLKVRYEEDLLRDRTGTVLAVLEHIGVEAPAGWHAAEPIKRQADSLSDAWVAAYHRDAAERSEQTALSGR